MASKTPDRNAERTERARADLRRINQQNEKLLGSEFPAEKDPHDDNIELWGKRIGRGLGAAFVLYLIWHLVTTYVLK